jgi:hypothetical protein
MDRRKPVNQSHFFDTESDFAPNLGRRNDACRGHPHVDLSYHARVRAQQRSIPIEAIEIAIDFGTPRPAGNGAYEFFLGHRDVRAARRLGIDLRGYEGTTVVATAGRHVLSIYHADRPTKRREV